MISNFRANFRPSASNFKSFSRSLEQFFLTVGQNNFGNKILFFQLSRNLTCYCLVIVCQFTWIYPTCSTYELTEQSVFIFWFNRQNNTSISIKITCMNYRTSWRFKFTNYVDLELAIFFLKPPKICTTFKQQATSVFTILNCRSGRTSCMWKFSVVATR